MNAADKATLKTYILGQADLAPLTSGPGTDYGEIMRLLNLDASPTTKAWRTNVPPADIDEAADYTVFDSIQAGKRDSWGYLIAFPRSFGRNKVRKWITDIWGNATSNSPAESILLAGTENASRAEVALGGNTKVTGTVSALDRNWEGTLSISDIAEIFNV